MNGSRDWLGPLTGILFVIVLIVGFAIGGEPKSVDDNSASEIVDWYTDNKDSVQIGALLGGIGMALFIFFGGHLRKALHAAEGPGGVLSLVAFGGILLAAAGIAFDATLMFAIAEASDDIEPAGVQTLQALWDNDFIPIAAGMLTFLWATGISIVRHGAFPKWLGWVTIVAGVATLTPAFFVGLIWVVILVLITSVMMSRNARAGATTA